MASAARAASVNWANAKPRGLPVTRSVPRRTRTAGSTSRSTARSSSSVVSKDRLPMKTVDEMAASLGKRFHTTVAACGAPRYPWKQARRDNCRLRGCERIPSRRRTADASRRAALLLLAIAPRLCLAYISLGRLARRAPRPPGSVRGFIHNLSRLVGEDRHARDRARAAQVVGEADLRALHLPRAGLAAELCRELVDHAHAGRAHRVAVGLEPARGIHRLLAAEIGAPLLDEPAALAARAEAQVLVVQDLGDGEAVVHLGEVDLRWRHLRLRVGLLGGAHRGLEAEVVEARLVVGLAPDRREPDAQGPHRHAREGSR